MTTKICCVTGEGGGAVPVCGEVADALVCSQLDYCNSLFRGLSKFNLRKLQCIQIVLESYQIPVDTLV